MKLFVDSADLSEIEKWCADDRISGVTTNPSLMKAAGVETPLSWAKQVVALAAGKSVSIDGPPRIVWELGENVVPKVLQFGYLEHTQRVNVTAICNVDQTRTVCRLPEGSISSVFAGRIMDTGRSPKPVIDAAKLMGSEVLWASVREPYNIVQAQRLGCDIVTVSPVILRKFLEWGQKSLVDVMAETRQQFLEDALQW